MKKSPTNKAKINLKNIKSFVQGYTKMFTDTFGLLEDHEKEQVVWRGEKAKACVDNGACLYCGCNMPGKLYSDEPCEDPVKKCYPPMMNKATWKEFKKTNLINIKID